MRLNLILKALFIGSTMTIPGVSGGTMAVITGIYEKLLNSINGLRTNIKKHLPFLLQFALAATIGFILFARFVTILLDNPDTSNYTKFFFSGIVMGGIPLLIQKSSVKRLSLTNMLYIIIGALAILLLDQIPTGLFSTENNYLYIVLQIISGFIIALALILPGISVSHMLYILGLYKFVLERIYTFKFLSLLPIGIGFIFGIFITASILDKLIKKHPTNVYLTIIGFVAASVASLSPTFPVTNPFICLCIFLIGFLSMYAISSSRR